MHPSAERRKARNPMPTKISMSDDLSLDPSLLLLFEELEGELQVAVKASARRSEAQAQRVKMHEVKPRRAKAKTTPAWAAEVKRLEKRRRELKPPQLMSSSPQAPPSPPSPPPPTPPTTPPTTPTPFSVLVSCSPHTDGTMSPVPTSDEGVDSLIRCRAASVMRDISPRLPPLPSGRGSSRELLACDTWPRHHIASREASVPTRRGLSPEQAPEVLVGPWFDSRSTPPKMTRVAVITVGEDSGRRSFMIEPLPDTARSDRSGRFCVHNQSKCADALALSPRATRLPTLLPSVDDLKPPPPMSASGPRGRLGARQCM